MAITVQLLVLVVSLLGGGTRVPVTIGIVESLPESGANAVVIHQANGVPEDVILIPRNKATPNVLAAALTFYFYKRLDFKLAKENFRVAILSDKGPPAWNKEILPKIAGLLGNVAKADRVTVAGIPNVRALEVWLYPPPSRR